MRDKQIAPIGEHSLGYYTLFEQLFPKVPQTEVPDVGELARVLEVYLTKNAESERCKIFVTDLWTGKIVYSSSGNPFDQGKQFENNIIDINDIINDIPTHYHQVYKQLISAQIDFAKAMHPKLYGSYTAVKHICKRTTSGRLLNFQVIDFLIPYDDGDVPRYVMNKVSIPKYEYEESPPAYLYLKGSGLAPKFLIFKPTLESAQMYKTTGLTRTELNCFSVMLENDRTDYIAEKLFISKHTVNTYKKNLFAKLGVRSITSLVKLGYLMGVSSAP